MDIGLNSGVDALRAYERNLDAITANLANLDVPAYKRQGTSTHAFEVQVHGETHRTLRTHNTTDFTQGNLEPTGNPFDLALEGDGFFAVETDSGEAYTRNGRFHVDGQGVLQTADGLPVVWEGARGTIDPVGELVTIDESATVRQGGAQIGRLKLVDFARRSALALDGEGNFHAPRGLEPEPAAALVHQATIEASNASSVDELVAMIRVQRGFETATSLIKSIDQSYRRLNAPR